MGQKSSINFLRSVKGKLILAFVLVGALPAVIIGVIASTSSSGALNDSEFAKLEGMKAVKATQIERYFAEREGDMQVLADTVSVLREESFNALTAVQTIKKNQIEMYFHERVQLMTDVQGNLRFTGGLPAFAEVFSQGLESPAYNAVFEQRIGGLQTFMDQFGFYDIFLIEPSGDVVFTVAQESDLGQNVATGPLASSGLGEAFQLGKSETSLVDFAWYDPSNEPASFLSTPLKGANGTLIGVAAFQMPLDMINNIMQERAGMGKTGETYLVGADLLMRSDSYLDPVGHSVTASFAGTVQSNGVDTEASREATAGVSGADVIIDYNGNPILSVFGPLDIHGLDWAIIAEIDVAEAFAPQVEGEAQDYFTQYKEAYGYYDLFLINPDGYVFYTVEQEADYQTNMVSGKYANSNLGRLVKEVLASKKYGVADFEPYEPSNGVPAGFIAQPVVHQGDAEVIVALQLPLGAINDIMQERTGMGRTGETYLVGPDMLMRSDSFLDPTGHSVEASLRGTVAANGVDTDASRDALAGGSDTKIIIDYNGNPVLSSYSPINIEGLDWAVIAEIDKAEVMESSNSLLQTTIIVVVISIAIVAAVGFYLSRMIADPLVKVRDALTNLAERVLPGVAEVTKAVAVGDVNQTASVQVDRVTVKSKDEIGQMTGSSNDMVEQLNVVGGGLNDVIAAQKDKAAVATSIAEGDLTVQPNVLSEEDALGNAFSQMVGNLRALIGQVTDSANSLGEASGQLSSAAEQAGQATQGIATASQQVAKGAQEQSTRSQEVTGGLGQLSRAIDQVAEGSQEQAGAVEQASSIVTQVSKATADVAKNAQEAADTGRDMVEKTVDGMVRIKGAVDTVSSRIAELGEQSAEIGKIITVIDDIAAQTNLLALNAAIEAARAGEQGRGFAVVADEVRKLAERVTDATREIGSLIDMVQKGVAESVKATEEGAKEVEEGATLAEEAGKALGQIAESVGLVAQQIEQISAAAEEVSASSDEMVKTIDGVSGAVEQNSAATEQMSANSTQVTESVNGIANVIEENSAAVQEMSASAEEMSAQVEEVVASSQSLGTMAQELKEVVSVFKVNGKNGSKAEPEQVQALS